jgi:hypothetical protein
MEHAAMARIREAVQAAQKLVHSGKLDKCDVDDIDEVITSIDRELGRPSPNKNTLSTYLNSLVRSLRPHSHAHGVCAQLETAMREAKVPTN